MNVRRAAVGVASASGTVKVLRYQPMPVGKKPPAPREGASSLTGPAIDQSWGSVTVFHAESSKPGFSAPGASACRNFQPRVNCWTVRVVAGAGVGAAPYAAEA